MRSDAPPSKGGTTRRRPRRLPPRTPLPTEAERLVAAATPPPFACPALTTTGQPCGSGEHKAHGLCPTHYKAEQRRRRREAEGKPARQPRPVLLGWRVRSAASPVGYAGAWREAVAVVCPRSPVVADYAADLVRLGLVQRPTFTLPQDPDARPGKRLSYRHEHVVARLVREGLLEVARPASEGRGAALYRAVVPSVLVAGKPARVPQQPGQHVVGQPVGEGTTATLPGLAHTTEPVPDLGDGGPEQVVAEVRTEGTGPHSEGTAECGPTGRVREDKGRPRGRGTSPQPAAVTSPAAPVVGSADAGATLPPAPPSGPAHGDSLALPAAHRIDTRATATTGPRTVQPPLVAVVASSVAEQDSSDEDGVQGSEVVPAPQRSGGAPRRATGSTRDGAAAALDTDKSAATREWAAGTAPLSAPDPLVLTTTGDRPSRRDRADLAVALLAATEHERREGTAEGTGPHSGTATGATA